MTERVLRLAVIMERALLANKWADHRWEAVGVLPEAGECGAAARRIVAEARSEQWLFPSQELRLYPDEAENYLLNLTAPEPRVFVMWRLEDDLARPCFLTLSYGEAARMLDAGEQVDGVAMPPEIHAWAGAFAREHYRPPEPRKGRRFASTRPQDGTP